MTRTPQIAAMPGCTPLGIKPQAATLPPDTDGMNDKRASWAREAVSFFSEITGSEMTAEAFGDLLGDLMHLADREKLDFDAILEHSRNHYRAETTGDGPLGNNQYTKAPPAAPTMLEALEAIAGALYGTAMDAHTKAALDKVNSAIAKATDE